MHNWIPTGTYANPKGLLYSRWTLSGAEPKSGVYGASIAGDFRPQSPDRRGLARVGGPDGGVVSLYSEPHLLAVLSSKLLRSSPYHLDDSGALMNTDGTSSSCMAGTLPALLPGQLQHRELHNKWSSLHTDRRSRRYSRVGPSQAR
jgi:hypothetical protein